MNILPKSILSGTSLLNETVAIAIEFSAPLRLFSSPVATGHFVVLTTILLFMLPTRPLPRSALSAQYLSILVDFKSQFFVSMFRSAHNSVTAEDHCLAF